MRHLTALSLSLLILLFSACEDKPQSTSKPEFDSSGTPLGHTANILSFGPRPPGSTEASEVRSYVTTTLEESGWTVGTQIFQAQTPVGIKTFTNLIARFPRDHKTDPWAQRIDGILCAHLDSKYYPNKRFLGADDAASACGLILSMATEMAANPRQASRLELVFFDGEEAFSEDMGPKPNGIFDGLYGSKRYSARWQAVKNKPKFGILLDMVGHKNLSIKVPADSPPELVATLNRASKQTGHNAHFGMRDGVIWDDHIHLNNAGIPTIDLVGDFSAEAWWHTPKDNLDLISAESLAITREVVAAMLTELLTN